MPVDGISARTTARDAAPVRLTETDSTQTGELADALPGGPISFAVPDGEAFPARPDALPAAPVMVIAPPCVAAVAFPRADPAPAVSVEVPEMALFAARPRPVLAAPVNATVAPGVDVVTYARPVAVADDNATASPLVVASPRPNATRDAVIVADAPTDSGVGCNPWNHPMPAAGPSCLGKMPDDGCTTVGMNAYAPSSAGVLAEFVANAAAAVTTVSPGAGCSDGRTEFFEKNGTPNAGPTIDVFACVVGCGAFDTHVKVRALANAGAAVMIWVGGSFGGMFFAKN